MASKLTIAWNPIEKRAVVLLGRASADTLNTDTVIIMESVEKVVDLLHRSEVAYEVDDDETGYSLLMDAQTEAGRLAKNAKPNIEVLRARGIVK